MSRFFRFISPFILLAAAANARAAAVAAASAARLAPASPIPVLGTLSIRPSLAPGLSAGQQLNLSGPLAAAGIPSLKTPLIAAPVAAPEAPVAASVRVAQLAEAAAPHIEAALDAKSGAETSHGAAAALLEPPARSEGSVAAEAAPAREPLVKDVSFDDGIPAYGGTTKHQRELLLESLRQRPEAWQAEFARLGIDLTRGEPRFRVLRTDLHLMRTKDIHGKPDFVIDLAYNIEFRAKGRRHSRVRLHLNPVSGEIRAFQGGTQRAEPVLTRLAFARGISLEERSLFNESLRRRKTAWKRQLKAGRFSLLGRAPDVTVLSVATHEGGVRTYLVRWQRGERKPRLMVVAIRPDGLTPQVLPAPPRR